VERQTKGTTSNEETRAAWVRTAVARIIIDTTEPGDRGSVREALADLGYYAGAPGAALTWVPDSEGAA
jgi:hypothetical protein